MEAKVLHASANPGRFDTDGDGVSDHDELREVGTDPMAADTSGDGFIDFVDAEPTQDSSPIEVIVEMNDEGQVVVQASGPARLDEVAVRGYYTFPEDSAGWTQWELVETDLKQVEGSWVRTAVFEPHLAAGMIPPAAVEFNVSDARGQSQSIRLAAEAYAEADGQSLDLSTADDDGLLDGIIDWVSGHADLIVSMGIALSTVVVGAVVVEGGALVIGAAGLALAAIVVVGIAADLVVNGGLPNPDWNAEEFAETVKFPAPPTGDPVATFPAAETGSELDYLITLPPGVDYGNGRGFGWEIVKRTPGITDSDDVAEILRAPNAVEQDGLYTIVIGDNPNLPGQVRLKIRAGTVIEASPLFEDPLRQHIWIPDSVIEKILNRHPEVGQSKEEVVETVNRIISKADEIYIDDLGWRMYVTEIGDRVMFLLAYKGKVVTAYEPYKDASRERTIQYIKEQIKKHGFEQIHEDEEIID